VSHQTDLRTSADPNAIVIGPGTEDDLPGIVEIINDVAANSIATFAARPTSVAEQRGWFQQFSSTGPYRLFVARRGDMLVGYACSKRYRELEAFQETVEVSIALDASCRARGVGSLLYRELFAGLANEPVHVALAGIAIPNEASIALHRKFGFTEIGTFREYAIKNGQYISSLWMQRLMPTSSPD
jgi:phosphinothricin acetyltransferase